MKHPALSGPDRRRPLIVGNWKMCASWSQLRELHAIAKAARSHPNVDVAICPPTVLLDAAIRQAAGLRIGAQDCHQEIDGPFTGATSPRLLRETGADLVIIGHSERRHGLGETDDLVRAKARTAMQEGLIAIVCVGETAAQREAEEASLVVCDQVLNSLPIGATADRLVVAYEPVWAIGSGRTPAIASIAQMTTAIRAALAHVVSPGAAAATRILYGGSASAENARDILAAPNVDGLLVGTASLSAATFMPLIESGAPYRARLP